jgi:hypothetical protein
MTSSEILVDAFERIRDGVHPAVNGLSAAELAFRPSDQTNSIAWLVWHLTPHTGRPCRRARRHRAGVDRQGLGRAFSRCRSM